MSQYTNEYEYTIQFLQYLDMVNYCNKLNYQEMNIFLKEVNTHYELFMNDNQTPNTMHILEHEKQLTKMTFAVPGVSNTTIFPTKSYVRHDYTTSLPASNEQIWSYYYGNSQEAYDTWDSIVKNTQDLAAQLQTTNLDTPSNPVKETKKKITINVNIENFEDLIKMIEDNPFDMNAEYNIDLKALHNIYDELKQIQNMIGLKQFKNDILDQLLYFMQGLHINKEHDYKHIVIYGPPGTGKTQIAKIIGTMYSKIGILKNNIFKKVTRNDLVAGYLGQTAIKTSKVIQECLGGVLFIDEVYSLGCGISSNDGDDKGGDNFSKECIDTLCEALSNYKDELMVIIAGYEKEVQQYFFKANPGLPSRFIWRFTIDEYDANELKDIFMQKVEKNGWDWMENEKEKMKDWFKKKHSLGTFKYFGRDMEQLFTYCKIAHGKRIYGNKIELRKKFIIKDIENGFQIFIKHMDDNKEKKVLPENLYGLYL